MLGRADGYAALEPRFTGGLPPPEPEGSGSFATTSTSSTVHPTSTLASNHTSSCQASSITCPQCNHAQVLDSQGTTYKVFCDNEIYSEHQYSVERWVTPEGCIAECDNFTWCGGSTFWPEGNCELARGPDVFPQSHMGRTAFLSVDLTYTPPPPTLSAYPTGTAPYSSPTATPGGCQKSDVRCPECNNVQFTDGLHETYCVKCNLQPICARVAGQRSHTSPGACMEDCDADPGCMAAIYDNGNCEFCQGTIESMVPYVLDHDYAVFVAEGALNASQVPSASGTTTQHWSSHRSTSHTMHTSSTHHQPSATTTPRMSATTSSASSTPTGKVMCPQSDYHAFIDPSSGRDVIVQCDKGLRANSHRDVSANDFEGCVSLCTGDCDGVQFAPSTSCGLYTFVGAITSAAGQTAGLVVG